MTPPRPEAAERAPDPPRPRFGLRAAIGAAVLVAAVVGILVSRTPAPTKAAAIGARVELAAGPVTVKQGASSTAVDSGVPILSGSEVQAGKGARALLRLPDGSTLLLRADTKIALADTGVELSEGEMWLDAPASERGQLVHKLGDVTVSAADAGISMKLAGKDASIYVARGSAVVTSPGGRVDVKAGEQATVAAGAAPKVAAVAFWDDWTGGMGDQHALAGDGSGSGRIYGVDLNASRGMPARTLEIARQAVRAVIRDGLVETEVDQTFGNPGGGQLEGWYWFTVPERAIVTSFAVETDGVLVEGEVIERQEAAAQYGRAARAGHEPALLEWINGKSYRARIFPIPASGSRRVVLRYLEMLSVRSGRLEYVYPMRSPDAPPIGEFSLAVDLGPEASDAKVATLADAVVEDGGRRVTMRRSGYQPRSDFQLEAQVRSKTKPLRVSRFSAGGDRADYVMARLLPDIDWASAPMPSGDVVVVVDTSASADEPTRQLKAGAAEATLRALSKSDRFTLIALDAVPVVLYPKDGLAEANDKEIAAALEKLADHAAGGATDLGSMFDAALGRVHGSEQPAIVYVGDGLATSGEITPQTLTERMRRSLSTSRARFFTVAVGSDANHALLGELARSGGGQAFRIDQLDGATTEVLKLASAIKTPTLTEVSIDLGAGLDEPMISATGKLSRGEELILLARTHHPLPSSAKVKGRLGGKELELEYPIAIEATVGAALVPRLWAAEKMRRLLGNLAPDDQKGKVVELGIEYGLVTPFTSILALESEQAFRDQGIQRRRSPLRGVRLTSLDDRTQRAIELELAGPPAVAMGCSRSEAPMASEQQPEPGSVAAPVQRQKSETSPVAAATALAGEDLPATAMPPPAADTESRARSAGVKLDGDDGVGRQKLAGRLSKPSEVPEPPAPPVAVMKPGFGAGLGGSNAKKAPPPSSPVQPGLLPGRDAKDAKKEKTTEEPEPKPKREPMVLAQVCSDAARRPLAERILLWQKRVKTANVAEDLIARYDGARAACEISDWRAESALLMLVQAKVRTSGAASTLLGRFAGQPETQKFVAQAILRRTVDRAVVGEVRKVLFGDKLRWVEIDNQLAELATAQDRVAKLRQIVHEAPGDPEAEIRLVRALVEANQRDEALALGRKLRDRGLMSPALAVELGDVMARHGERDDAIRTYSEVVEFDPGSADARRLLGDVCMRQGWYAAAYRQYKTLTDLAPTEPLGLLRLGAAAGGEGRIDEALRILRGVASAEGTPGPDDPRLWARLLSAERLGRLLADGAKTESSEGVTRKLKELGLWSGPGAMLILGWEDFDASLSLVGLEGETESTVGERYLAPNVGLVARMLPLADADRLTWAARWKNDAPGRSVKGTLTKIAWDGKAFRVTTKTVTVEPKQREALL